MTHPARVGLLITLLVTAFSTIHWLAVNQPEAGIPPVPLNSYPLPSDRIRFWQVQSLDTMKLSRDQAREPPTDQELAQIMALAKSAGANYIAIGTPYDEEFYPVLKQWADAAHHTGLSVWFRGNFAGWEGWFDYEKNLSREEHLHKTASFLADHPDLFADGDSFSACPECENGGPGDPRVTGDREGYLQFIRDLHDSTTAEFTKMQKLVFTNWFSMNGDIAKDIMDATTAAQLKLITIDHYVATPEQFAQDIINLHQQFGVPVLIGEFGAPVPDIHGDLDDAAQATVVSGMMGALLANKDAVYGMNYWTLQQGSTALLDDNLKPKPVLATLKQFWQPVRLTVRVIDTDRKLVNHYVVKIDGNSYLSRTSTAQLALIPGIHSLEITAPDHPLWSMRLPISDNPDQEVVATLDAQHQPWWQTLYERWR